MPQGSPIQPVSRQSAGAFTQGGPAIPVFGVKTPTVADGVVLAGPALRVRVIGAAELRINGGTYELRGDVQAMRVTDAPASMLVQGDTAAIPIFITNPGSYP